MASPAPTPPPGRWRWLLPVGLLVALVHFSPVGRELDYALFDFASRHPLREPALPGNSALVLIDDATVDELGRQGERWPFRRATFAALIAGLDHSGARAIVVDLAFLDHSDAAEQDLILAVVTAASPKVVLATTGTRQPAFWNEEFRAENPLWFTQPRVGRAEFNPDPDGVARRYTVSGSLAGNFHAGIPAPSREALLRWHGGLAQLREKGVPVLPAGPYIAAGRGIVDRIVAAAPDLAVADLARAYRDEPSLTGAPADAVRGRVVFVGANASGTFDVKPFPIGGLEPGLLIHWTAWTNLVGSGLIWPLPPWSALLGSGAAVGILLAAVRRRSGLAAPVALAASLVLLTLGGAYAGLSAGWFFPPAVPVVAITLALIGIVAERFWAEQARKREIQAMFGAYVDPAVVSRLVDDPQSIPLRGEKRDATVFFSDLAGFTDLSEKLPPERMVEVVNAYLEDTSECLHQHGAYVDKYIGDAVMAVFGAPSELANHALAACRAALDAQKALEGINVRYADSSGIRLAVRIGLNTGEMIVGNLGSSRKKNYTVMGDTVNLGSRLEGANKHFGTGILMGPETARRVRDHLAVRPLARLRVKGKQQAVEVFTLHGEPGNLPPAELEFLEYYRAGYEAFVSRRFVEAAAALSRAEGLRPDDQTTLDLRQQAEIFSTTPPPADWEPVTTLDSK